MKTTHTPTPPAEIVEIWSIQDIASFYHRSIRQATRIASDITFPRPLRGDKYRWVAKDVITYAISSDHGDEGVLKHEKSAKPVRRIQRSSKRVYQGARSSNLPTAFTSQK